MEGRKKKQRWLNGRKEKKKYRLSEMAECKEGKKKQSVRDGCMKGRKKETSSVRDDCMEGGKKETVCQRWLNGRKEKETVRDG